MDDYAEAAHSASLSIADAITVEAWVYVRREITAPIAAKWNALGYSYVLEGFGGPNQLALFVSTGGAGNVAIGGTTPTGRWVHMAGSYDGLVLRTFIDGTMTGVADRVGDIAVGTAPLQVCARRNIGTTMDGDIEELRITHGARYTATFSPPTHLIADLNTVGLWDFKQGLQDLSGHANHLVLYNGAALVVGAR